MVCVVRLWGRLGRGSLWMGSEGINAASTSVLIGLGPGQGSTGKKQVVGLSRSLIQRKIINLVAKNYFLKVC